MATWETGTARSGCWAVGGFLSSASRSLLASEIFAASVLGDSTSGVGETGGMPDSEAISVIVVASYTFADRGGVCFALTVTFAGSGVASQFKAPYPPPRKMQTARRYAKSAASNNPQNKTASFS